MTLNNLHNYKLFDFDTYNVMGDGTLKAVVPILVGVWVFSWPAYAHTYTHAHTHICVGAACICMK